MVKSRRTETPGTGEVIVEVAGCGVCHTDLGYYYDGVPTRHAFPLTLGHEISGKVVEAGPGAAAWMGKSVVVPAVLPCGTCPACKAGRGSVCAAQIFPGNDVHGGFATHVLVPARGLCPVPRLDDRKRNPEHLDLASLAVIADAVTTPYQALLRSELQAGDLAVFVGAGGVGGFGVQIAGALGAVAVAIDVDDERLNALREFGAALTLRADQMEFKALRQAVRRFADEREIPTFRRKIFETSGTPQGQTTAFGLLEAGSYLGIVGFTPAKVELRLSNLMAFDATVQGNWGCLPEHYPAAVDLVLSGRVRLAPFLEKRPLSSINQTFADLHARKTRRRVVLIPD
ncbi:MAG: 6-hydroxycyclohex-1-ene-1-carbonyl-CoA dehydrogenase [Planctomycetes bacterium]|nr:6-hydroxycyclohex-1-ene-1-carbonyl-CoA dehydrogenase [Planctomycetota bacterium]